MNIHMNENKVREMAYGIWESEGKPSGQSERHWYMAMQQAGADEDTYADQGTDYVEADLMDDSFSAGDEFALQVDDADYVAAAGDEMEVMNGLDEMDSTEQYAAHQSREKPQSIAGRRRDDAEFAEDRKSAKGRKSSAKKKSSNDMLA